MKRLTLLALLGLAACAGPVGPPPAGAPACTPADGVNVYVRQGTQQPCQLQVGQRLVVEMPRSQGSDDALRTICLTVWHGASFIVNFGALDYCVFPARTA